MKNRLLPCLVLCCLLASATFLSAVPGSGNERLKVSLELVLLIDVSASVDQDEYLLQRQGLAAAFASPPVRKAIRALPASGMAVSVVQWGNYANQKTALEWTRLTDDASALAVSAILARMPRMIRGGHTAIGDALAFGLKELNNNRFEGLRRVIDLSGDGRSNDGRSLGTIRKKILTEGVTINGLAIINEIPLLGTYFRDHVAGGTGSFAIIARDYSDFTRAIREKLEREIRSAPLASGAQSPIRVVRQTPKVGCGKDTTWQAPCS